MRRKNSRGTNGRVSDAAIRRYLWHVVACTCSFSIVAYNCAFDCSCWAASASGPALPPTLPPALTPSPPPCAARRAAATPGKASTKDRGEQRKRGPHESVTRQKRNGHNRALSSKSRSRKAHYQSSRCTPALIPPRPWKIRSKEGPRLTICIVRGRGCRRVSLGSASGTRARHACLEKGVAYAGGERWYVGWGSSKSKKKREWRPPALMCTAVRLSKKFLCGSQVCPIRSYSRKREQFQS